MDIEGLIIDKSSPPEPPAGVAEDAGAAGVAEDPPVAEDAGAAGVVEDVEKTEVETKLIAKQTAFDSKLETDCLAAVADAKAASNEMLRDIDVVRDIIAYRAKQGGAPLRGLRLLSSLLGRIDSEE